MKERKKESRQKSDGWLVSSGVARVGMQASCQCHHLVPIDSTNHVQPDYRISPSSDIPHYGVMHSR